MKTALIYLGYNTDRALQKDLFYRYSLDIGVCVNILDFSRIRHIVKSVFSNSDGVIFIYDEKSWPDLQKIMLIEFERSSVFVNGDKPYVVAKGFNKLCDGIFFDYVYDKPILFLKRDIKENVDLGEFLKPFNSNNTLVKIFRRDLSKSEFCIYSDEVESVLSMPADRINQFENDKDVYTLYGLTPEEALFDVLKDKCSIKIATAESCTAGLVAAKIANVPGVSEFFEGGVITYSNKLKVNVLRVNSNILYKVGAVSEEVARQMALGAINLTSADYSVAVTGIAGPSGATKDKPVGLVYIAAASKNKVVVEKNIFKGNRMMVRDKSARFAILLLRDLILS